MVNIYRTTMPWTPKDLDQRGGRGARKGNVVARLYANNKVDNFMYASEGSLDTYMFNLLQNKQTFINQLKTGSLGTRIIDEGAMDADGAMNYSEFVAILSGNNDLLEKAKLEKKIFALESEYKGYKKQLHSTEIGLRYLTADFERDQNRLEGIKKDWAYINDHLPANEDGIRPNPIQLDNFPHNNNIEAIGNHLIKMDKYKRSFDYEQIGNLLDFKILMKTEKFNDRIYNKFYVEGSCKYSFNNGNLAETPELAATNFIRAFDRIPKLISDYESDISQTKANIAKMQNIVNSPWKKEIELKWIIRSIPSQFPNFLHFWRMPYRYLYRMPFRQIPGQKGEKGRFSHRFPEHTRPVAGYGAEKDRIPEHTRPF